MSYRSVIDKCQYKHLTIFSLFSLNTFALIHNSNFTLFVSKFFLSLSSDIFLCCYPFASRRRSDRIIKDLRSRETSDEDDQNKVSADKKSNARVGTCESACASVCYRE